ncbi:YidC/Oxa1 family membrane protein insertase [Nonomuraea sp. NPDC050663]|uniref:YidC/Oxa1 family membrane protein insertase n=1 Tax=Nonomuraea sp. NPDC050663 TaxID=3364370 RepID=UPI0037A2954C
MIEFITGLAHPAIVIVVFTLAVRLLILPLAIRQARVAKIRQKLAPRLKQLQKRYAKNPERLQKEITAAHAQEGISVFAGFLPALAQLPFMWLMYRVATHPTALVGYDPLGLSLSAVVANFGLISWPFWVFAAMILAIIAVAWLTSRRVKAKLPEDQPEMMRKMLPLMAYGAAAAALFLPMAAGLYLLISTTWSYAERVVLYS